MLKNTYHQVVEGRIVALFTHQLSILRFLLLTAFFVLLEVVFGQSTSLFRYVDRAPLLSPVATIAITSVVGYAILVLSRWLLYRICRQGVRTTFFFGVWVGMELVVGISVMVLVMWALCGACELQLAPLSAVLLLNIISVLAIPYGVTYLLYVIDIQRQEIDVLQTKLDEQMPQKEEEGIKIINFYDKGNRLAFATPLADVLYVEAADNYTNIHYLNEMKEDCFILHNSMKEIEKRHTTMGLIRCHRGYMVNVANVKMVRKEAGGLQIVIQSVAKPIPVSKTYEAQVLTKLNSLSPVG